MAQSSVNTKMPGYSNIYFPFCRKEILVIRKISAFQASIKTIVATTARMTSLPIFVAYLVSGHSLKPISVFLIFAYAKVLGLAVKHLGRRAGPLFDCNLSVSRIQKFLETVEESRFDTKKHLILGTSTSGNAMSTIRNDNHHHSKPVVSLTNVCCKVNTDKMLLKNVSIRTEGPQIITITGPVGSGKTSLLLAILGELPSCKGHFELKGKMAFVGQLPWVFSGTLRDNITFNKMFDSAKFTWAVEACALTKDIEQFPDGDLTTIGERGIVLSGGQRARVSMARALYSDADIYLLDDPLSCVDAQVGDHIFENYIRNALGNRLCLFVTHQPCYMKQADHIIVMNEGSITWEGGYSELASMDRDGIVELKEIFQNEDSLNKRTNYDSTNRENRDFEGSEETSLIMPKEDRNFGSVSYMTYWKYFRAGVPVLLMISLVFLSNTALGEFVSYCIIIPFKF